MMTFVLDSESINALIWVTFSIGFFVFWIAAQDISILPALLVSILKVFFPLIYFSFFYNDNWNFLDDITYYLQGTTMLELGYNPISALVEKDGVETLMGLSLGKHILYGWWNLLSQYLFGRHYFSSVFLNIALTSIIGYFLARIARLSGFSRKYSIKLLLFFLFHWEMIPWSSMINLKDILVMFLTILTFFAILKISEGIKFQYLILLSIPIYCFYWIRFYAPFMILLSALIWWTLFVKGRKKYVILFFAIIFGNIVLSSIQENLEQHGEDISPSFMNLIAGPFRMLSLTPQPWSIQPQYTFLFIPSILNWIFFLPTLIGGWNLWNQSKKGCILLIYLVISLIFYANFPGQDGPRQRVQLIFIIAWMQFNFLYKIFYKNVLQET